ncbi:MAG: dihydrolipoyl dehydrogenase [Planctomycetota bacterium]
MNHDLVVIGAGPGGYVAAIRAAQLGLNVGIIEKEPALGGTCLRVGCIPSKALLESSEKFHEAKDGLHRHGIDLSGVQLNLPTMLSRKDQVVTALTRGIDALMKKNKITRYVGHGALGGGGKVLVSDATGTKELTAKNILIATGSKSAPLRGVEIDGVKIGTSTEALNYAEVPKRLAVIGAGVIGLELGSVWLRLGAQVTVFEYMDRILPGMDSEIAAEAQKILAKQGFEFRLKSKVTSATTNAAGECVVACEGAEPFICDKVLLAVGRVPNTDNLNLDVVGVQLDKRGRIPVNAHYETAVNGIFAVGDVIVGPMLAHKAEEEGVACVEQIVTGYGHVNYDAIPGVVYTSPEIASVGKTEDELKEAKIEYKKGVFPFLANGRARAINNTDGRVKMLADAKTDRILGVHIIGPHAGDLIAEAANAIEFGASSEDLARACHAHPTLAEAVKEAAFAVSGRAIHF